MTPKASLKRLEMRSEWFPVESKAISNASRSSSRTGAKRPVRGEELSGNKHQSRSLAARAPIICDELGCQDQESTRFGENYRLGTMIGGQAQLPTDSDGLLADVKLL